MSTWKENNAVKRIFNAFKRSKDKIYKEDVEALKLLNEMVENASKETSIDNLLYAKLLCVLIRLHLEYYKDIKLAIKKASDDLKHPINFQLELLNLTLNQNEKTNYLKSLAINLESYKEQKEILTEHQKEIIVKLNENWNVKTVSESFYKTANTFLKDIENYK